MNQTKQKSKRHRVAFIWLLSFLIFTFIIVAARFILPPILLKMTNKTLTEMEGYRGHIDTFDFNIKELGFEIGGFEIKRVSKINQLLPFFYADKVLTYIDWESLWRGKILGREIMINPVVNFVNGPNKASRQTGTEGDINTVLKKLETYQINQIEIIDGKITYSDSYVTPKVSLYADNLQAKLSNIKIVIAKKQKLPSQFHLSGTTIGSGKIIIDVKFNAEKQIPDFDANLKLTKLQLNAFKNFTKAYAGFDFEKGTFSLYGEMAMKNTHYKGYVKPLIQNIKVFDIKKDKDQGFFKVIREALIGAVIQLTINPQKKQFATEIPFEGDFKEFKVEVFKAITNVFKNAFGQAFHKRLNNSIDINLIKESKNKSKKP